MIDVIIEDENWPDALEMWASDIEACVFKHFDLKVDDFETSLLACDANAISALNLEYREKSNPTNVLSWPSYELAPKTAGGVPKRPQKQEGAPWAESLGDMAICFEVCAKEATAQKISLESHAKHLILHGFLHLLGYDHIDDRDAKRMEDLEVELLASLGIRNPYLPILDDIA